MARSYGQIVAAIWRDPDFQKLPVSAQWTYIMLATQGDISSCGLLSVTLGRWSKYAADLTRDALSDALSVLADQRFVVVDWDTEELLVRSFAKWDGGSNNQKRRLAITAAANAVVSPILRVVVARELDKLGVPHAIEDALSDGAWHSPSDDTCDRPRVVVTEGDRSRNPEPEPQPATLDRTRRNGSSEVEPRNRATRVPADWKPTPDLIDWQREQGISDTVARRELPQFIDYWTAKSGRDATKLDWPATWRNWLRRAQEQTGQARPRSTSNERAGQALELAARLREREQAGNPREIE